MMTHEPLKKALAERIDEEEILETIYKIIPDDAVKPDSDSSRPSGYVPDSLPVRITQGIQRQRKSGSKGVSSDGN